MKLTNISIVIKQERVYRLLMQKKMVHIHTVTPACGGCDRLAVIQMIFPISAQLAMLFTKAALSTVMIHAFVLPCG